jgi:hypothetical protein
LQTCPYNADRVTNTDRFSLVPVEQTPLSIQIVKMLQKRLRQHR